MAIISLHNIKYLVFILIYKIAKNPYV